MIPLSAPSSIPLPPIPALVEVLAVLGRPVEVASDVSEPLATLELTRQLVAVAECHAFAAERALCRDSRDHLEGGEAHRLGDGDRDHDERDHNGCDQNRWDDDDIEAIRDTYERLTLAHWRAGRLASAVEMLRGNILAAVADEQNGSGITDLWDLAAHTTVCGDSLLEVLARLVTAEADADAAVVLDAATTLLVSLGERAGEFRALVGLDEGPG